MKKGIFAAAVVLAVTASPVLAEQCTQGVHAVAAWTRSIEGNAVDWIANARKLGFHVDHLPGNGTVVVYPPSYGHHINARYGHVAYVVDADTDRNGKITVIDSNGICGGTRRKCKANQPNWLRAWVIHPK
ncbi:MAG: CHAP domain-containing protein [Elusimicrobia bacterium]|nr:CHAP domain-containing protein [Elusimicrobiota bacterium]